MTICITGSSGLIGSTIATYFLENGHTIVGIDNNTRQALFGKQGNTTSQKKKLVHYNHYVHYSIDIRSLKKLETIFSKHSFDAIVHCAGQPSHDKARDIPLEDFEINAMGTLNLLEMTRRFSPQAMFIFMSTNKVYGDVPNTIPLIETETRFEYADKKYKGVNETTSIDQSTHSLMGVSKATADLYVQEYAASYGMHTANLRLGCVTGAVHAGVKLHGFLSFLIKSLTQHQPYEVIGYKGKQVRDQIHAIDVAHAVECMIQKHPTASVFNMGGGQENNASILELIVILSNKLSIRPTITFNDTPRIGDHICYISDTTTFKKAYPQWKITRSLDDIIDEQIAYEQNNKHS